MVSFENQKGHHQQIDKLKKDTYNAKNRTTSYIHYSVRAFCINITSAQLHVFSYWKLKILKNTQVYMHKLTNWLVGLASRIHDGFDNIPGVRPGPHIYVHQCCTGINLLFLINFSLYLLSSLLDYIKRFSTNLIP